MTGVNIAGRAVVEGRPFPWALTQSFDDGVTFEEWSDGWQVPTGGGAAEKIAGTVHVQDGLLGWNFRISPDGSRLCYLAGSDDLWVANADGSGAAAILTSGINNFPQWIDNEWILHLQGQTVLRRIRYDGTGAADVKAGAVGILGSPSNDGTLIAYETKAVSNGVRTLGVIEPDGTNDLTLDADVGPTSGTSPLEVIWRHDDSAIVFLDTNATPDDIRSIAPDGTGLTIEFATIPASVFHRGSYGMHTDRFFFAVTTFGPGAKWTLHQAVFGVGISAVSPERNLSRAVQRGFPMVHEGRVYGIHEGNNSANGLESVFSILPDGSDFTLHFVSDESGTPWFETPTFA